MPSKFKSSKCRNDCPLRDWNEKKEPPVNLSPRQIQELTIILGPAIRESLKPDFERLWESMDKLGGTLKRSVDDGIEANRKALAKVEHDVADLAERVKSLETTRKEQSEQTANGWQKVIGITGVIALFVGGKNLIKAWLSGK